MSKPLPLARPTTLALAAASLAACDQRVIETYEGQSDVVYQQLVAEPINGFTSGATLLGPSVIHVAVHDDTDRCVSEDGPSYDMPVKEQRGFFDALPLIGVDNKPYDWDHTFVREGSTWVESPRSGLLFAEAQTDSIEARCNAMLETVRNEIGAGTLRFSGGEEVPYSTRLRNVER